MPATCPIWLVVGFLGAGKTTLLRRLVHSGRGRNLVYVVNEFSAVDVDAGLIEREGGAAIGVAGGSLFCRCLVSEFVDVLRRVSNGTPGNDDVITQPEGVVIEASGMADPRSMRRLLTESRLDERFHVAGVTVVVDPGTLMKLLLVLPNIRGQVESADLILLNKTDLHAPETIEKVCEKLVSINPHARVIRCMHCGVEPAIILADGTSQRLGQVDAEFGACRDPRFQREVIVYTVPVDLRALCGSVVAAGEGLYRAKGYVKTTQGWRLLDLSAGVLSVTECEAAPASALTLIWNPELMRAERVERIRDCMSVARASQAQQAPPCAPEA